MSVVANIAEMLQLDAEPDSRLAADLGKIVTQARRVTEMMRSLLNFVRQAPAQYAPVDLVQIARETLDLMSYELRKARVEEQFIADPVAPPVWGDRSQLQHVLLNLLANALQAMKGSGRITIRIRAGESQRGEPNAVALIVEDTGSGIAPEALGKIFDFFFTTRAGVGGAVSGVTDRSARTLYVNGAPVTGNKIALAPAGSTVKVELVIGTSEAITQASAE